VRFSLDLFLRGIDDDGAALAEHQFLDLDEAEQAAGSDLAGVDLVHLPLVDEKNFENVTRGHQEGSGNWYCLVILYEQLAQFL